jgi:hypothetical protein
LKHSALAEYGQCNQDSWMASTLDTLDIVKRLREAGFSEPQAEAVTTIFRDVREADFAQLVTRTDLRELEQRVTIRVGGMLVVATGVLLATKFFG